MADANPKRRKIRPVTLGLAGIAILLALAWWMIERAEYRFLAQDEIWAAKVKREMNFDETRAWASAVIQQATAIEDYTKLQTFLTNAPTCLLKNYKHRPFMLPGPDCIHLTYGGGFYHWGLTIGATNLPASSARGGNVKQWSAGIYYWQL